MHNELDMVGYSGCAVQRSVPILLFLDTSKLVVAAHQPVSTLFTFLSFLIQWPLVDSAEFVTAATRHTGQLTVSSSYEVSRSKFRSSKTNCYSSFSAGDLRRKRHNAGRYSTHCHIRLWAKRHDSIFALPVAVESTNPLRRCKKQYLWATFSD